MASFVYETWGEPGISVTCLSEDVAAILRSDGHTVELVKRAGDAKNLGDKHVISDRLNRSADVLGLFRYAPPLSYQMCHAYNLEEFSGPLDWFRHVIPLVQVRRGSRPVHLILQSPRQRTMVNQYLRSVASASVILEVNKLLDYELLGIADYFTDVGLNDPALWVVPFNRWVQQKSPELNAEITAKALSVLAMRGHRNIRATMYVAARYYSGVQDRTGLPWVVEPQPESRQEYVNTAQRSGISLCTSSFESFGLYYLELIACGCVVVFLDRPWIRELLPGYPYIADAKDLPALLVYVFENFPECKSRVSSLWMEDFRGKYMLRRYVDRLVSRALA